MMLGDRRPRDRRLVIDAGSMAEQERFRLAKRTKAIL